MAVGLVQLPAEFYPEFNRGRPLSNGQIFVGEVDTDPEIPSNQKQVTLRHSGGVETPVDQPVITGAGGVPSYQGSPAEILVDGDYSLKVLNVFGTEEYYFPDVPLCCLADGDDGGGGPGPADRLGTITVTVGAGGDYPTIGAALEYLSNRGKKYDDGFVIVNILAGEVINEQVVVNGVDLSWIQIQSQDAEVTITVAAVSENAFWTVRNGGDSPRIETLFQPNPIDSLTGMRVEGSGSTAIIAPGAGFKNFITQLDVFNGGSVHAQQAILTGSGNYVGQGKGIWALTGALVSAGSARCENNTYGVVASGASKVYARSIVCSNSDFSGIDAANGAIVECFGADLSDCRLQCVKATWGATVTGENLYCDGTPNHAVLADNGSKVMCDSIYAPNTLSHAVHAIDGAVVNARDLLCTNAGGDGIRAENGSYVNGIHLQAQNTTGFGVNVIHGSIVNVNDEIEGTISQTANVVTPEGIIFQQAGAGGGGSVIGSGSNASGQYRLWSDGFIEQWGRIPSDTVDVVVTFPVAFTDQTTIGVIIDIELHAPHQGGINTAPVQKEQPTLTTFEIGNSNVAGTAADLVWFAQGY